MAEFVWLGFGHARADAVANAHADQVLHILGPDFFYEPAHGGIGNFVDIIIEEVEANELGNLFRNIFREFQTVQNLARHFLADDLMVVESRVRAVPALGARLPNVMEKRGDPYDERPVLRSGMVERAQIVLPNR